ncbi:MAG: helix-turn-helix domain-containing protein [Promethearchaeati archaeon SRVP18_Atabeyarchaeia-1]
MCPTRCLNITALSKKELAYLLGLYIADGYSHLGKKTMRRKSHSYRVGFCLNIDELELARRIAGLLRRIASNPQIHKDKRKDMWIVLTYSKALFQFLPRKSALRDSPDAVNRFLEENKLASVECGIPFIAGLIDGDGNCQVCVEKGEKKPCFGAIGQWKWSITQSRYLFLIGYAKGFVECLAPASTRVRVRSNGPTVLYIRKLGIIALLDAGIAEFSYKAVDWLKRVDECRSERRGYLTTGQVARMLNVSYLTVERWIKSGRIRHLRKKLALGKSSLSWYYIPVDEAKRVEQEALIEEDKTKRIRRHGVRLMNLAGMLGISYPSLLRWHQQGKLETAFVREGSLKYLVVQQSEIARLERVLRKAEQQREETRRIESEGVKLIDVSRMAHISRRTLNSWCQRGKLKATMVRQGIRRCLVVPKDEFERLIRDHVKKRDQRVNR